jgi:hypothetical protein
MSVITIPAAAPISPQPRQMARNGLYPTALFAARVRSLANHAARYRTKQVANFTVHRVASTNGTLWQTGQPSPRTRWRSVFHSSPYAGQLRAALTVSRQQLDTGGTPHATPGFTILTLSTMAGVVLGRAVVSCASSSTSFADNTAIAENWSSRTTVFADVSTGAPINIPPNTDLQITVTEQDNARTMTLVVFEDSLAADTANGYIDPNVHNLSPILASSRQGVATLLRNMWLNGASHLFNWSFIVDSSGNYGPRSTASATPKNIVDVTSTANTASSPGWTLDLSNTGRVSNTNRPVVVVQVYGKCTVASNGTVSLTNSGGGTMSVGPFGTSLGWVSAIGSFIASAQKYDLLFSTAAGTLSVEAVSVYLLG